MSNSIHFQLSELATLFAQEVLATVRSVSLGELLAAPHGDEGAPRPNEATTRKSPSVGRSSGRLPRRSAQEIAGTLEKIVRLVKGHKTGLRAEQIRQELGLSPKEMPRILKEGLSTNQLKSKGQKRATTYLVA